MSNEIFNGGRQPSLLELVEAGLIKSLFGIDLQKIVEEVKGEKVVHAGKGGVTGRSSEVSRELEE